MNTVAESSDLREDAELVIEVLSEKEDIRLDYSADSIFWLDGYIDEHRAKLDAGDKSVLREKLGAFVGESIRHNFGGRWVKASDGSWMIVFDDEHQAAPFEIIGKHLDQNASLAQAFEHLPNLMLHSHN